MSKQERIDHFSEIEDYLKTFSPQPSRIDTAQLMFLAGQESAKATRPQVSSWLWPAVAAAMTVVAAWLGVLLSTGPEPVQIQRIVYVDRPIEPQKKIDPPADESLHQDAFPQNDNVYLPLRPSVRFTKPGYLRDRQIVLALGVDALGSRPSTGRSSTGHRPTDPLTPFSSLRRLLLDFEQEQRDADSNKTEPLEMQGDHS